MRNRGSWLFAPLLAAGIAGFVPGFAPAAGAKSAGLCATATDQQAGPPFLVVLSAFPAELAPFVHATTIESTVQVDDRSYYVGRLEGVSVVLGLTGIGLLNATSRTESVLGHFAAAGLIMSGVAGTQRNIGDVAVADDFKEPSRKHAFRANLALLALARLAATRLPTPLENCTPVPPTSMTPSIVCFPYVPTVYFGGHGESSDPFGKTPLACTPGAGEVFGCELPAPTVAGAAAAAAPADPQDMETAAVARVAAQHHVPFLGVRAGSDGHGDPRGDRGFPAQFFDYYDLAAHNEGILTHAVVAEVGRLARDAASRRTCRLLARRKWRRAAARIGAQ
jgi:hypothetical protein